MKDGDLEVNPKPPLINVLLKSKSPHIFIRYSGLHLLLLKGNPQISENQDREGGKQCSSGLSSLVRIGFL
jgi:hypothetical protein